MSIPVYGLSGIDDFNALGGCSLGASNYNHARPLYTGKSFKQYANKIKNNAYKEALINRNDTEISTLNGVFDVSWQRVTAGHATNADFTNIKKIKILITLNNKDYHAYRIAQIILPYAVDIDETDGGYLFPSAEIAQAAADGEARLINYLNTPGASELGFEQELGSLKSIMQGALKVTGKALKAVGKAVVNSVVAPVKATVQATKAAVNVTKAGVQAMTGNSSGAKESLQKALQATKSAIVDPVKTAVSDTKNVVQTTVIDPTKYAYETTKDILKTTVKIGGKIFKVLFLKINPLTVATRNALRALMSINFLGMATRFNVGLLTEAQAAQLGYSREVWQQAVKAIERIKKFYKKMGGNPSKIIASITKGAGKKPLFKKDVSPSTVVNVADNESEESTLGMEPATLAAILALTSTFISILWEYVKMVVKNKEAAKQEAAAQEAQAKADKERKDMEAKYAHNNQGEFFTDENGNLLTWEEYEEYLNSQQGQNDANNDTDDDKKKKIIIGASVGVALIGGVLIIRSLTNKNK